MRTIAITNQKGGVGKTTTVVNLGHALALEGNKVLLIDLDPQSHLSPCLGLDAAATGLDTVLLEATPIHQAIMPARENLDLIPSGSRLQEVEQMSQGGSARGKLLDQALWKLDGYDFVLCDCPPSAALLTCNALFACKEVLFPVPGDFLSLQAFSHTLKSLKSIEKRLQRHFRKWLALTRFQPRRRLAREIHTSLCQRFPNDVLKTPIRERAALAEAPSLGRTVFELPRAHQEREDFHSMAREILQGETT